MSFKGDSTDKHSVRMQRVSKERRETSELDIRLDLALGAPEDLTNYQDCIRGARRRRTQ